jgi:dihydrofolate reductase
MTGQPGRYESLKYSSQIEFTSESPVELTGRLKSKGHEQVLIIGGPHVATSFLNDQLIDELWLTFEPRIFGIGDNFATGINLDINLRLIHFEKVNKQGTLITKYAVLKK